MSSFSVRNTRVKSVLIASVVLLATSALADEMKDDVYFLADKKLDGRAPGTEADGTTRTFIVDRFKALKLAPAFGDSYEQPFTAEDAKR